ncbi:hypothetical protein [uncultured Williamsia sp.]|uniref:hypothetical protein n=1 Tax=uncultured Williamsia sp. TaxID=259311 RepID=UPI002604D4FF|nr:hypothetical protein [uncultured Williamsia sp.]
MKIRLVAPAVAVVALCSLTACGASPSDTATPSPQTAVTTVVTITRAPTTTPLPVDTTDPTDDETSTLQPAPTTATNQSGSSTPEFVGHYQAHDSEMDISSDNTGWMDLGDGAANYERWRTAWSKTGDGMTLRLVRRDEKRGLGVNGPLVPGTEFAASFTTGGKGVTILHMTKAGQDYVDWCDLNRFGYTYECGA